MKMRKVFAAVFLIFLFGAVGAQASERGYAISQIAEGYLPVNELFIAAAVVTALALIPMSMAAKMYKERNK